MLKLVVADKSLKLTGANWESVYEQVDTAIKVRHYRAQSNNQRREKSAGLLIQILICQQYSNLQTLINVSSMAEIGRNCELTDFKKAIIDS